MTHLPVLHSSIQGEQYERIVQVQGMAVADDEFGDVYMIPLVDIVNDIKNALGMASVRLPHDAQEPSRLFDLQAIEGHAEPANIPGQSRSPPPIVEANKDAAVSAPSTPEQISPQPHSYITWVWHCHKCGNGPTYGNKFLVCSTCGHSYCGSCTRTLVL